MEFIGEKWLKWLLLNWLCLFRVEILPSLLHNPNFTFIIFLVSRSWGALKRNSTPLLSEPLHSRSISDEELRLQYFLLLELRIFETSDRRNEMEVRRRWYPPHPGQLIVYLLQSKEGGETKLASSTWCHINELPSPDRCSKSRSRPRESFPPLILLPLPSTISPAGSYISVFKILKY